MAKILTYLGSFQWLGGRKFLGLLLAYLLIKLCPEQAMWITACYGVYSGMNVWEVKKNATE